MRGSRILLRRNRVFMNLSFWMLPDFRCDAYRRLAALRPSRSPQTKLIDWPLGKVHVLRLKIQRAECLLILR